MTRQAPLLERMRQELDVAEASGFGVAGWRINTTAFRADSEVIARTIPI